MSVAVEFNNVDIVFGGKKETAEAIHMLDSGAVRSAILEKTGAVLGCAGVNLTVDQGEISVLMGLSGSGKSTLLRTVNGLNRVARGEVSVHADGWSANLSACSAADLRKIRRKYVTMVFQQFGLLPWRTVEENVGLGLELAGLSAIERKQQVRAQLELVGLGSWDRKYVHELSGGMQQRVGLARAFATEAPILLMDEPFSALDPLIRARLQDQLLQLQTQLKKTIIFVTHDLEEALKIGNRISIMEEGRIVQSGTPSDIVLRPETAYVRDFVANVNPISVITAQNVMRDRGKLESAGDGWVWLDRNRTTRFKLDQAAGMATAVYNGEPMPCLSSDQVGTLAEDLPYVLWARPDTPLKVLVKAMQKSHAAPIALLDENAQFAGAIDAADILTAVIR